MCRKCKNRLYAYHNTNTNNTNNIINISTRSTRPIDKWCRKRNSKCCHNLFGHHPSVFLNK